MYNYKVLLEVEMGSSSDGAWSKYFQTTKYVENN